MELFYFCYNSDSTNKTTKQKVFDNLWSRTKKKLFNNDDIDILNNKIANLILLDNVNKIVIIV